MAHLNDWAREYIQLVDKLWSEGDYQAGHRLLMSILMEEPGLARAHGYLGWYAHIHLEDRKTARVHYEYALQFDSSDAYAYVHFAELLVQEKDLGRMRRLLREGMDHADVDKAHLYNDYGRILEMKNRYKEADHCYKEGQKYTMNYYTMCDMKANRKRVRSKYRLFAKWYSFLV